MDGAAKDRRFGTESPCPCFRVIRHLPWSAPGVRGRDTTWPINTVCNHRFSRWVVGRGDITVSQWTPYDSIASSSSGAADEVRHQWSLYVQYQPRTPFGV